MIRRWRAAGLAALALLIAPMRGYAQTPTSPPVSPGSCDDRATAAKRAWAVNPHGYLANVFHKETFEIGDTWCRIWETSGADRRFKAGDFGRTLFSGDGLRPAVASSLVPGSGLAGGAALTLSRALQSPPMRLSGGADGRYATNGSWIAGGQIELLGSGARPVEIRHNNGTGFVERQHLAALSYFGQGNASPLSSPSVFALDQTTAGGAFELVTPQGLRLAFGAEGVSSRSTSADTPALAIQTTHLVYGARIHLIHPSTSPSRGNQVDLAASASSWHEVHGRAFDFSRVDIAWLDHYTPRAPLGTFSVMGHTALAFVPTGQSMPFFEQPTIGGTDLGGNAALRSFSDYRFRAPNAATASVEHERDLIGPIATLLFADVGMVADTRGALASGKYHRSFGGGVSLRLGNTTVFRLFYAWGGGEGTRTTTSGSSDSFVTKLVSRGPF